MMKKFWIGPEPRMRLFANGTQLDTLLMGYDSSVKLPVTTIPKRGEKEYEPAPRGGSSLQEFSLKRSRQAMINALSSTRTIARCVARLVAICGVSRIHTMNPIVNQYHTVYGYLGLRVHRYSKLEECCSIPWATQPADQSSIRLTSSRAS